MDNSIDNNTTTYIKADNNVVVNEKYIRWITIDVYIIDLAICRFIVVE
jgi:hypothetical protein